MPQCWYANPASHPSWRSPPIASTYWEWRIAPPRSKTALARRISSHGHQATHIFDASLHAADDPVIWEHTRQNLAVLISNG